jgi:hypothetical protein
MVPETPDLDRVSRPFALFAGSGLLIFTIFSRYPGMRARVSLQGRSQSILFSWMPALGWHGVSYGVPNSKDALTSSASLSLFPTVIMLRHIPMVGE